MMMGCEKTEVICIRVSCKNNYKNGYLSGGAAWCMCDTAIILVSTNEGHLECKQYEEKILSRLSQNPRRG